MIVALSVLAVLMFFLGYWLGGEMKTEQMTIQAEREMREAIQEWS